jgi:hypothetical protein
MYKAIQQAYAICVQCLFAIKVLEIHKPTGNVIFNRSYVLCFTVFIHFDEKGSIFVKRKQEVP